MLGGGGVLGEKNQDSRVWIKSENALQLQASSMSFTPEVRIEEALGPLLVLFSHVPDVHTRKTCIHGSS